MPAVGQYTPSTTIPYYQRHSRSINDTSVSLRRQKHTFGNEVYKDSFMQRSLAQSSSLGGEGVPGVGQYTKAVVIPFYQRHSSRSSSSTRRHTWGSEQYDAFKRERERETDDSTDRGRTMTCSDNDRDKDIDRERDRDRDRYMYMDKDRDRDMERDRNMNMERDMDKDRKCSSSETCSSSHGSRSTTSASTSAPYTSRSMSASRGSHRNEDRDGGGTGLPQTPGERKFRTLLHMISNIGSGAPTATRDKTYR